MLLYIRSPDYYLLYLELFFEENMLLAVVSLVQPGFLLDCMVMKYFHLVHPFITFSIPPYMYMYMPLMLCFYVLDVFATMVF